MHDVIMFRSTQMLTWELYVRHGAPIVQSKFRSTKCLLLLRSRDLQGAVIPTSYFVSISFQKTAGFLNFSRMVEQCVAYPEA